MKQVNKHIAKITSLLFLLVIALGCIHLPPSSAGENPSPISEEKAVSRASALMEKVLEETRSDENEPCRMPEWEEAKAGKALLIHSLDGKPTEYLVPIVKTGSICSVIGISAKTGDWTWFKKWEAKKFPLVSAAEASTKALQCLSKLREAIPQAQARIAPNKEIYWVFEIKGQKISEVYVPAFKESPPFTNLDRLPWKNALEKYSSPSKSQLRGGGSSYINQTSSIYHQSIPTSGEAYAATRYTSYSGSEPSGGSPGEYDIPVPYHPQLTDYWCGPAALQMVFDYFGPDIDQGEIASVANAKSHVGVYCDDLLRAAHFSGESQSCQHSYLQGYTNRKIGYAASGEFWANDANLYQNRYNDLKYLISSNYPVIILTYYDSTHTSGHFRVVKGFNDSVGAFIVHDPWSAAGAFSGPDIFFNQSFLVDDLWTYSNMWGMITAPWELNIEAPPQTTANEVFNVNTHVNYPGPSPLGGEYPCSSPTATIGISDKLELTESHTKSLPGIGTTGSREDVSWNVKSKENIASLSGNIEVIAGGRVYGMSQSYSSYSDFIGGEATLGKAFYFAEGCTRSGFEQWLCLQNPNDEDATVNITYMLGTGENKRQQVTVKGKSRETVNVNLAVGANQDVSTKVESSQPIVAERPMYFAYGGTWTGGHDVVGAASPAKTFYFAEGTCRPNFDPYICIQNPADEKAEVSITYMLGNGATHPQEVEVGAHSRYTIRVIDVLGTGDDSDHDFSAKVESTNGVGIIAERPMYFNYHGTWTGGHDVMGASFPSTTFYFAEGCTRSGFEQWLCLQNPNDEDATVNITYMLGTGENKR
ncbi:MAG: DUF5719 family protein, partial [Actinomycetota bacterium]|nr:DUF5719 family protein [Actinomycetota bacterium]